MAYLYTDHYDGPFDKQQHYIEAGHDLCLTTQEEAEADAAYYAGLDPEPEPEPDPEAGIRAAIEGKNILVSWGYTFTSMAAGRWYFQWSGVTPWTGVTPYSCDTDNLIRLAEANHVF